MANFVTVQYHDYDGDLVVQEINRCAINVLHPPYLSNIVGADGRAYLVRIAFSYSIVGAWFKTMEEAQSFYDLLRGNKPKDKLDRIKVIECNECNNTFEKSIEEGITNGCFHKHAFDWGRKQKDKLDQIREALKKIPTVAALQILNEIKDILDEGEE